MRSLLVAASFFLLCTSSAFARPQSEGSGNDILSKCQTAMRIIDEQRESGIGSGVGDASWCIGWVTAVVETNLLRTKTDPVHFCAPKEMQIGQAVRVIVKYLRDHPERLHERGIILALTALQDGFPCK